MKYGVTRVLQMWKVLTILQKRVVRLVCGARRLDHKQQLGILKFVDLVKFKTSITMFKAYHYVLPDSLQTMYKNRILAKNVLSVFIVAMIVPIPT